MHDLIRIGILIGSCLGLFTASLVIIELCLIKYKDLANVLIFFLMLTDLIMGIISLFIIFPQSSFWCLASITVSAAFKQWHKYIIFFIAFSMYKIIVKEKTISFKFVFYYLIITLTISILIEIMNATILIIKLENVCILYYERNTIIFYVYILWEYFSDIIIFISLCFFYMKIKKVLRKEAENCSLNSARKRFFAKRLFGYCVVFSFYILPYLLGEILNDFGQVSSTMYYEGSLWLTFSWYPFFDSIVYGFTKSFKRNFFNCIWKSPDFDTTEETLQILREENILRPRFYLDMVGESEINILLK